MGKIIDLVETGRWRSCRLSITGSTMFNVARGVQTEQALALTQLSDPSTTMFPIPSKRPKALVRLQGSLCKGQR